MNHVVLSGYVSLPPELRRTESGKAVCSLKLAVRRTKDVTDFLPVTCWGNTAEFVSRNFHKGSRVEVSGSLRQNDWEDSSGTKHYAVEIIAGSVDFGERASKATDGPAVSQRIDPPDVGDGELPS